MNKRLKCWKITLSEYDFEIIYRKRKLHSNADAFSCLNPTSDNIHNISLDYNSDNG
jgi:hypothetical protein